LPFPLFHPARRGDLPALLNADAFAREFPSEGDHVEFKNGVSNKVVQAAAAAFSNSEGGVCLFGVAPDGRVVGLHQPGEKTRQIHQALRDVSNPGRYQVHELVVDAATVLVLAVARRHEGFAQTSGGAVLARRGASNVPLLGEELSAFLARRTFQRFELTPTSVMVAEADPERCTRLGAAYSWPADNELSRRLDEAGFAVTDGGRHVLTVAGSLFLVPDPSVVGGRPFVDLRRYPHGEPDPDRTWQIDGPADALVRESTRTVLEELGTVSAIIGAERVDMPKIPPRVIREVMSNAVAHRSYEHAGSAIRVDLHPTHLVVTSPGGLPEPVTIDNLRHQQSARNDRVLGALRRFNLAEDRGLGIDRMQDDMAAELSTRRSSRTTARSSR
jgi:ATP-dependent DNA helicase RecG